MISYRDFVLLSATVLLSTVATLALEPGLAPVTALLGIFVAPPVVLFALVLLAHLGLDAGPPTMSKGELERLVKQKNQGLLLGRSRRAYLGAARPQASVPDTRLTTRPKPPPIRESPLDRLVRAKRRALR